MNDGERIAAVEARLASIERSIDEEKKSMGEFKTDVYRKLDWIKPAIVLLAAIMVLLHPTIGDLLGIIK